MLDQNYEKYSKERNSVVDSIVSCDVKDASGLNDFQKLPTEDFIYIPKVGITNFRLPIEMMNKFGERRSHDCVANMGVSLNAHKNGVSMSRLCRILQEESQKGHLSAAFIKTIVGRYEKELADENDDEGIDSSFLKIKFMYPIRQKSLKSENWGWQYYACELEGKKSKGTGFEYFMTVDYHYSSTCPCSLSMAKQYEREFQEGKITEGVGIGVAHSQRSKMTCKVKLDPSSNFFIEDLITTLRSGIPTETQVLVKRADEQAFAILNGTNPMFVEHASKRISKALNSNPLILDWLVSLEHLESLHSHNAAAVIYKGVPGGLREDPLF